MLISSAKLDRVRPMGANVGYRESLRRTEPGLEISTSARFTRNILPGFAASIQL